MVFFSAIWRGKRMLALTVNLSKSFLQDSVDYGLPVPDSVAYPLSIQQKWWSKRMQTRVCDYENGVVRCNAVSCRRDVSALR